MRSNFGPAEKPCRKSLLLKASTPGVVNVSLKCTLPGTRSMSVRLTPPVRFNAIVSIEAVHREELSDLPIEFSWSPAQAFIGRNSVASNVQRKQLAAILARTCLVSRQFIGSSASAFANTAQAELAGPIPCAQ